MRTVVLSSAVLLASILGAPEGVAQTRVGSATAVVPSIVGRLGNTERSIQVGDPVFFNQRIQAAATGETNLEFLDRSRLTVGPGAEAILDRFVFDPDRGAADISISLAKGAFRFVSGTSPKEAYKINTPTATLGIRGTSLRFQVQSVFDSVLVEEGAARMCHRRTRRCVDLVVGQAATFYRDGRIVLQPTGMEGPGPGQLIQAAALRNTRRAGIAEARSFASALVTGNVSHIGNVGRPSVIPSVTQSERRPQGLTSSEQALASSDWRLVEGDPSVHFSQGTNYGPITANGSQITALNQAGVERTSMERTFTMPVNSSIFSLQMLANFVTTEFPDFIGRGFNDTATVTVVSPSGATRTLTAQSIFNASVDGSVFTPVSGLPSPLAGYNPGDSGGQTGFQNATVLARAAPGGTVRVIVSVTNVGDTAYPSALLAAQTRATAR